MITSSLFPVNFKAQYGIHQIKETLSGRESFMPGGRRIPKESTRPASYICRYKRQRALCWHLAPGTGFEGGNDNFFEGDDSTSIDGSFRLHGTGSEDYFNGGWYAMMDRWDDKMSLPLHGSLGYSLPFCRTGGYRLYLSDKLSFEKSFFHSIEHGPVENDFPADYTSLGLYYSDSPPEKIIVPTDELTKVYIPDTLFIYPQLMDLTLYREDEY